VTVDVSPRPLGRPRDARAEALIVDATKDVLADVGYGRLTVDAVAARAGVGKATIYRRFPSKEALVLHAMKSVSADFEVPDTGSVRGDLVAIHRSLATHMRKQDVRCVLPVLVAEASVNPAVRSLLNKFVTERRAVTKTVVTRAIERGELREVDADVVADLVGAPLLYRLLVSGMPIRPCDAATYVDVVLDGILRD
jgi:AcrR family transcriptional regulator